MPSYAPALSKYDFPPYASSAGVPNRTTFPGVWEDSRSRTVAIAAAIPAIAMRLCPQACPIPRSASTEVSELDRACVATTHSRCDIPPRVRPGRPRIRLSTLLPTHAPKWSLGSPASSCTPSMCRARSAPRMRARALRGGLAGCRAGHPGPRRCSCRASRARISSSRLCHKSRPCCCVRNRV